MTELLAICVGGALGAMLRGVLLRAAGPSDVLGWPPRGPAWATLVANTLGCLLFGVWIMHGLELLGVDRSAVTAELAVTAGFCGGLTTFSSLCADVVRLGRAFGPLVSGGYLASTIVLGLGAFWTGLHLVAG